MTSLFDRYLLFRLQTKRDEQAFADLYDRYVQVIYRFVYLKLPSKEMAEDVTSETFLRFWQFLRESHEPINNIRAFLYRIARNLVIDTYRKNKGQNETLVTFSPSSTSYIEEGDQSSDPSDHSHGRRLMEARVDLTLVVKKLSRLKDDYRDVLTLRLIDGLAFGDIANVLEKTPGHVRVIYHRGMKALEALDDTASHSSSDQIFPSS